MTYLLDTNVLSELRKRDPSPNVVAWFSRVSSSELFVSALTVGEIRRGIELLRRRDATQAALLEQWLAGLLATFGDRVTGIDAEIGDVWGRLNVPDPLPVIDGLLAATAKARGWTLVTRNTGDIQGAVATLNPFEVTS
ncbi:MAG TPA: type II toxin-antitoxin system VapC family toxin [Streptosporangiaceae bacterium]|nr:type II toxin-antitoxin system VapC family toxin [Streptosporangiaceae bacterium]